MTHFTYEENIDTEALHQGDLLSKTPELTELLETVHPHYLKADYTHFQVLTQSCDLVLRSGKCKARYLTLAAVRPLPLVIEREIDSRFPTIEIDGEKYLSDKNKVYLTDFLSRLFNNNNGEHFFLRASPMHGLFDDSCTFLHISIALRASDHYERCLKAKIIQLDAVFQSKLGWLAGNMYSRVATPDYVPSAADDGEFKDLLDATLKGVVGWVPQNIYSKFKAAAKACNFSDLETVFEMARASTEERQRDQIKNFADKLCGKLNLDNEVKQRMENALMTEPALKNKLNLEQI